MNKKQLIVACVVIFLFVLPVFAQNEDFNPFPKNKGTIYEYNDNDIPDVCFFPVEKAKWNGYKVTINDWEKLTDFQKSKFISEGVEEIKRNEKGKVTVDVHNEGWTMLTALNEGVGYLKTESSNLDMPMIKLLQDTLKGAGKIEEETKGDI